MSLLIVSRDQNDGHLLKMGLEGVMGGSLQRTEVVSDPKIAFDEYRAWHPDVILICGFASGYSEALVINIRGVDQRRHTGIVVMATMNEDFDHLAVNNYNAGVDDVVPTQMSTVILKSKIITVFNHKLAADELRTAVHNLQIMNTKDELTGLANMRGFLKKFGESLGRCQRGQTGLAIVMMDLDHFKKVNDSMNHMVGSYVIKSVGHILRKKDLCDSPDFAARYGGDEYIIVFHGTDAATLMAKADKIRRTIKSSEFTFQDRSVRVTCSMGLCWVAPKFAGKPEDMVKAADAMLYKSKDAGRDTVTGMILDESVDVKRMDSCPLIDWKPKEKSK